MKTTKNITINNNKILLNGNQIFEAESNMEADAFFKTAFKHFKFQNLKFYKMDSMSRLGFLAAEILLANENWNEKYAPEKIGVLLANSASSLDTDLTYFNSMSDIPSPALFVYTLPNIVIGEICIRHKIKGETCFFVMEKFNKEFIENYAKNLAASNTLDACIIGWVELYKDNYFAELCLLEK